MSSLRIDRLNARQWCYYCYGYGWNESHQRACEACQGSGLLPLWLAHMHHPEAKLIIRAFHASKPYLYVR
jgi:hypothetical protein